MPSTLLLRSVAKSSFDQISRFDLAYAPSIKEPIFCLSHFLVLMVWVLIHLIGF